MNERSTLIKGVTIFIPEYTDEIKEVLDNLIKKLDKKDVAVYDVITINDIFDGLNIPENDIPQINAKGDIVISIGGDGTVLKTLLIIRDKDMPLLSIGLGQLNFLSSTDRNLYLEDIDKLFKGRFYIRSEMRLDVEITNSNLILPPVLNEILYHSSKIGKTLLPIVEVKVRNYREILWSVKSDGVLIATPIGSTAYSYAAGGPVIDTNLEAVVITPLIPTSKIPSYVVSPGTRIILRADRSRSSPCIVLDGQIKINLDWDQEVEISRSSKPANIITFHKNTNLIRMKRVAERYGGVRE